MAIINNIKEKIGDYILKGRIGAVQRDRKVANLSEAKSFGIIFDSSNKDDFELVKKYVGYLKEMKKKVKVLGYFSTKDIPEMTYSKLEYDFFSERDLNSFRIPSNIFVNNFIHEEYDILINLNLYDHFPLKYIGAMSRAKYKVGRFDENNKEVYDMLIECPTDKSFKYFLRQVDTYLAMINNKQGEATNS